MTPPPIKCATPGCDGWAYLWDECPACAARARTLAKAARQDTRTLRDMADKVYEIAGPQPTNDGAAVSEPSGTKE